MLRISNIRVAIEKRGNVLDGLCTKLRINKDSVKQISIYKESLDARKNKQCFIYTVDAELTNEKNILKKNHKDVNPAKKNTYLVPESGSIVLGNRPVIVGSGPCGLFAAYLLAEQGYRPILFERGADIDTRTKIVKDFWHDGKLNISTNVQFGEGGAGTFSDGKLTTNIKDKRCRFVLGSLIKFGAPENIIYSYRPHVGTDLLRKVVKNIRNEIINMGGEVQFNTHVTDIIIEDNEVTGVIVNGSVIKTNDVILAIGHSARDTYKMLYDKKVHITQKPFSIGLRIEHLQTEINKAQHGKYAGHKNLEPADYRLKYHDINGRSAYSFCMCPGGVVVASSSEENEVVTNGMSYHARDGVNANSAILVGVGPKDYESDHPLAGVEFQRKYEQQAFKIAGGNYKAPAQLVGDFISGRVSREVKSVKPSYKPGIKFVNLNDCLPSYVAQTLKSALKDWGKKIKGFDNPEAVLTGVETRSSAPLRIMRNEDYEANVKGLYPAGEGAGYAGGIVSAAVDGLRVAEAIIKRFAPFKN